MSREIKVSIILPSLNVAKYIRECIESVINQSLRDIEILCVDAGSTDGTLEIIREYAAKDSRIKVLVSDRRSYGYQMNLGIAVAQGEYIGIVETDDFIPKEMYEELYLLAREKELEIIKTDFYHFVGTGDGLKKEKISLTTDKNLYNRVINIENEQKCLLFPVNTWTGIYKRNYVQKYNICHNETPGSSFQDNGFGFLVFVYSKRVVFLDKPYYMHRNDNPNSSINSREKVFCICDEFRFVWDTLKKDEKILEKFKDTYILACFGAYIYHLRRIANEYRRDYLERFAHDFLFYQEQGKIDYHRIFGEGHIVFSIMESPEGFYQNYILPKKKIYDKIHDCQNIIIYGAGKIGANTYCNLINSGIAAKVLCFAVSDKKNNPSVYQGHPVCEINTLLPYCENSLVIVAAADSSQAEICTTLEQLNFLHYINWKEL